MGTFQMEDAERFYDRFGKKQDKQGFYEDRALEVLIARAAFDRANGVLEFGCGTGRLAERLLSGELPAECRYLGLDLSDTMVELARARVERFGDRAVVRKSVGGMRTTEPDASFDRFLSTYVLDLLEPEQIDELLAEAHRVLLPGGLLVVAGLTHGEGLFSGWVSRTWGWLRRRRPSLVGGCRPIRVVDHLRSEHSEHFEVEHREVVTSFAISSECLVARRKESAI